MIKCCRKMIQRRWLVHPAWGITSWERLSASPTTLQPDNWEVKHVTLYKKEEKVLRKRDLLTEEEMRALLSGATQDRARISWLISAEVKQMMMDQINHMSPYHWDRDSMHHA